MSTTTAELIAASLLSGVGTGLLNPPVNASVTDVIAGDGRDANGGTALAGFQMVGDVGAIVGPVLAGMIVEGPGTWRHSRRPRPLRSFPSPIGYASRRRRHDRNALT